MRLNTKTTSRSFLSNSKWNGKKLLSSDRWVMKNEIHLSECIKRHVGFSVPISFRSSFMLSVVLRYNYSAYSEDFTCDRPFLYVCWNTTFKPKTSGRAHYLRFLRAMHAVVLKIDSKLPFSSYFYLFIYFGGGVS